MSNFLKTALAILLGIITLVAECSAVNPRDISVGQLKWAPGSVEGRIYKNASLGIEFTVPPEFEFRVPQIKGTPGSVPLLISIAAFGQTDSAQPRDAIVFYADALAYYRQGERSASTYAERIRAENESNGFTLNGGVQSVRFGGVFFLQQDFKKGRFFSTYQSVLVKTCRAQVLVFIFRAADQERIKTLLGSTYLKLDLGVSECATSVDALPGNSHRH
jgi:hypothetical protein